MILEQRLFQDRLVDYLGRPFTNFWPRLALSISRDVTRVSQQSVCVNSLLYSSERPNADAKFNAVGMRLRRRFLVSPKVYLVSKR